MNSLLVILSPLALLLPAMTADAPSGPKGGEVREAAGRDDLPKGFDSLPAGPFEVFQDARRPQELGQVRIEQRVIIRISPGTPAAREQMMADLRRQGTSPTSYQEEKLSGCIAIASIAGVQPAPQQNRLLLFMRDRRILSAALEQACSARDYYSGFYVERNEDGQLCARRDLLQSRAGASCKVAQLNRLVAVRD
ncbi:MAG TPA: hypothetical protein VI168_19250 [Croceibacterium sp.]